MTEFFNDWAQTTSMPILKDKQVHLWLFTRQSTGNKKVEKAKYLLLNTEEKLKAEKFLLNEDRRKFIEARIIIKNIISLYIQTDPLYISYIQNENEKPLLKVNDKYFDLGLSLSHSGEYGLLAVSKNILIGVDIQKRRADINYQRVITRFYAEQEKKYILTAPLRNQSDLFYKIWTLKEAFIKTLGSGFPASFSSFAILLKENDQGKLIWSKNETIMQKKWFFKQININSSYFAALAANEPDISIEKFLWP